MKMKNANRNLSISTIVKKWLHRNFLDVLVFCVIFVCFFFIIYNITTSRMKQMVENNKEENTILTEQQMTMSSVSMLFSSQQEELLVQIEDNNKELDTISSSNVESGTQSSGEAISNVVYRYFDVPLSEDLQNYINELSIQYNVPVELIFAIIDVESNFNSDIISSTNDYGLCQINLCNHDWLQETLGVTDIMDPKQNVLCGTYIISGHLQSTNGDVNLALMSYNCGSSGAKKLWNQGIYSTVYSRKVMSAYEKYLNS